MEVQVINPIDNPKIEIREKDICVFLAGGCWQNSWRTNLTDKIVKEMKKRKGEFCGKIYIATPYADSSKIKLSDLIRWEHDAIMGSRILVYNFEASSSPQPGTLYELGRFIFRIFNTGYELNSGCNIINAVPGYVKERELREHISIIKDDFKYDIEKNPKFLSFTSKRKISPKSVIELIDDNIKLLNDKYYKDENGMCDSAE